MSDWKECKLGDVADLINGFAFKSVDFSNSGIPVVKIKNIASGKLLFDDVQYHSFEINSRLKQFVLRKDDILIAMTGSHVHQPSSMVGKVTRYDKPFPALLNQRVGKIVSRDPDILSEDFIYYFLRQEHVTIDLAANAGGSANQANISSEQIRNMPFYLPPLPKQRAIAGVLSSLDDKIDFLHRQNKTLEEMAEALWQKMFVEDAGPGWKNGKLGDFGRIICGKTPSKKVAEYFGGYIPFIKIPDMHGNVFIFETEDSLTEIGERSQQLKTIPARSICVSCIATVGLVCMNAFDSQTNQQINTIIPKKECYRYFLFLLMRNMTDDLLALASGGTATDNLNTGDFSRIEISLPSENTIKTFDGLVKDFFEKLHINSIQIRTLSCLRDTLLPRLMSGRASVRI